MANGLLHGGRDELTALFDELAEELVGVGARVGTHSDDLHRDRQT